MNGLFRDPVVTDIDSLKLKRKSNEVSGKDEPGMRMNDLESIDIHSIQAPPKIDKMEDILPDTVYQLYTNSNSQNTVQIPVEDEDNFQVHSYHNESSTSSKRDTSDSKSGYTLCILLSSRCKISN